MLNDAGVHVTRPIVPGSVVVARGLGWGQLGDDDYAQAAASFVAQLVERSGHDRFVFIYLGDDDGDVTIHGPADLVEALHRSRLAK